MRCSSASTSTRKNNVLDVEGVSISISISLVLLAAWMIYLLLSSLGGSGS